jgi:hypothetical protein
MHKAGRGWLLAAGLALGAVAASFAPTPGRAQQDVLSPSARFDVLRHQLNQSVRAKKPEETLKIISEMRKLPQGVKGEFLFFEGHAHYQLENWDKAYRALVAYLNAVGRKGRNYNLAISLFINSEKALKAARQGGSERQRAGRGWTVAEPAYARVLRERETWKEKAITFGGPKDDTAWAMARRAGGGFLVAGTFHQPEDKKSGRKESRSMGLISLSREGKMAWNRVILGPAKDGAIRSLTALADGGFLVGGIHRGFQVAARLDKNAVPAPNFNGDPWVSAYARASEDAVPVVIQATDGTVLALGSETVVKDGKSARLPFATRLTGDGNALGKTLYSGNARRYWHDITDAAALPGGDIVVVGEARPQAAWDTRKGLGFVMRITSQGRLVWADRIPAEDKNDLRLTAVVAAKDGGVVAAGRAGQRLVVMKLDDNGRRQWLKSLGYRDLLPAETHQICPIPMLGERIKEAYAETKRPLPAAERVAAVREMACPTGTPFVSVTSIARRRNGYLLLGMQGRGDRRNSDMRLIAVATGGEVLWDRIYGHAGFDVATSALATEDGGMIIAGATESMGTGGRDFLMFKVDEAGAFAPWTKLGPPARPIPRTEPPAGAAPAPSSEADGKAELKEKTSAKPPAEATAEPGPGEDRESPDSDERQTESESEGGNSDDDTSIGAIFGSIFGGGDPKPRDDTKDDTKDKAADGPKAGPRRP